MYKEQLIVWLKANNKSFKVSGKEIATQCLNPEHQDNNPSFSINHITGSAYCFSCGFKSHANRILDIQPDDEQIRLSKYLSLDRLWEDQESVEEPTGTIILPPVDFYISESIRGVSSALLEELGVYYCSHGRYKGRLVFPVKDTKGNLIGFDARTYEHHLRPDVVPEDSVKHAKYLRPTAMKTVNVLYPLDYLWNHRTELDLSTIVLVEGIFDAISYIQLGIPAVCNFGVSAPTPTKAGLILSLGVESIANGLDNDKAGVEGWQGTETKVSLKEAWRQYLPIAKPMALTKAIWASEFKDASEYLENFKVL